MFVIIGLGNPGSEYEGTRHNIGFAVIDALAEQLDIHLRGGRGEYVIGLKEIEQAKIALVKPLTYMNNSGIAVREIVDWYKISLQDILVITDDFQLPLGSIRIRQKGSDGGHNGLYSIIYHLQSNEFPRLRCGIASDAMPKNKKEMPEFVLSPFQKKEDEIVQEMIINARSAVNEAIINGTETAMNRFNNIKI